MRAGCFSVISRNGVAWACAGLALVSFFFCWRAQAQADPLQRWDLRYPMPPELGRILFANGTFVGLPPSGTGPPFTSTDGVHWSHASVRADTWGAGFSGIDFGNGRFFGVSRAGQVFTSADATNWTALSYTPVAANSTNRDIHIAAGNGVVVTASAEGGVSASADGRTWSWPQTLDGCPKRLWFGNGTFLALLTCDPGGPGVFVTSADGITWTPVLDPVHPQFLDVSFSDGLFTAVSSDYELVLSLDGMNWSGFGLIPLDGRPPPTYFVYGGGRFVGFNPQPGSGAVVLTSPDGDSWYERATIPEARGLAYGNGIFLISGRDILTSPDGMGWTRHPGQSGALPTSVAFGAGRFVAVGGNTILISLDGAEWSPVDSALADRKPAGIYYVNGLFIGPSWPSFNSGSTAQEQGFILTSTDGLTWAEHAGPAFLSTLRRIVHGNGRFLAIGNGDTIYGSSDGANWTGLASLDFLSNLVFGNGVFLASASTVVAPGEFETAFYISEDGAAWTRSTVVGPSPIVPAAFGHGVFVAQTLEGPARVILTSPDGRSWTRVFSGLNPGTVAPAYVAYGGGELLVLNPYRVLSSSDGVQWQERAADGAAMLAEDTLHPAVAYGQGTFVTVTRGNIQQSAAVGPPFAVSVISNPSVAPENGPEPARFQFTREGGASADLDLTVRFSLGGTAINGLEYVEIAQTLLIPAGQTTGSVLITPIPDPRSNVSWTVVATVLPDAAYSLGPSTSATVRIVNSPVSPALHSTSMQRLPNGQLQLTVLSGAGAAFSIDASSDLISWEPVATAVSPTGVWEFTDGTVGTAAQRFYRVGLMPGVMGLEPSGRPTLHPFAER